MNVGCGRNSKRRAMEGGGRETGGKEDRVQQGRGD